MKNLKKFVATATAQIKAELVFKNANILNVFTKEFILGDVAVCDGYIVGVGAPGSYSGKKEFDLNGAYLCPGFIDSHVHIESSMVLPTEFAKAVATHGTTTIIADPHEIANVMGIDGVRFMVEQSKNAAIDIFFLIPSCVPATDFEHAGGKIDANDIKELLNNPRILGLGEMMNYVGVVAADENVLGKLHAVEDNYIDGHAPGVGGLALQAYRAVGIKSDHETFDFDLIAERIRSGMYVFLRNGSSAKELQFAAPQIAASTLPRERFTFCTDDMHIEDVLEKGHIDNCLRTAVDGGIKAIDALCMASWNAAQCFGLKDVGAVCAGYKADLVILDNLENPHVQNVFKNGTEIFNQEIGISDDNSQQPEVDLNLLNKTQNSVCLKELTESMFEFGENDEQLDSHDRLALKISQGTLITDKIVIPRSEIRSSLENGTVCKLAVLERHHNTGYHALGLLQGYTLKKGAIATTVGHDSHNIICAGNSASDMKTAVEHLQKIQGGFCIVLDGEVLASLTLSVAGLMSAESAVKVQQTLQKFNFFNEALGISPEIEKFVTLSFLALPVIPNLRMTDQGYFDVTSFRFIED